MRMHHFVLLVSVVLLAGCIQQKDCRVPSDCDLSVHPNCSSDWMCVDGRCVWDCGGCSLSRCDCKCHPTGQTAEELSGKVCGIDCQSQFNVSGCQYRGGKCAELYVEPEKNITLANPASVYCVDKGHRSEIRTASDGSQYGVCILSEGLECDEWSYYHGSCVISSVSPCVTSVLENISGWKGIEFIGGKDSVVIKQNLSYVCCANISVSLSKNASLLRIYEDNVGEVCRCICGYVVNVTIPELSAGTYRVEVYGVSFEDTEGQLLGNATVTVGDAQCAMDEECVPAQCCHPTSCILEPSAPDCSGKMCTMDCRAGSLDCGQGRCVCENKKCAVEWSKPEGYCETDADCVPEQCCHPTSCIPADQKGVCNVACTKECRAGTMDCGAGSCNCKENKCAVEWTGGDPVTNKSAKMFVSTDKSKYALGETVKITIRSNVSEEMELYPPAYGVERLVNGVWQEFSIEACPCNMFCDYAITRLMPYGLVEEKWDQREEYQSPSNCNNVITKNVAAGSYRIVVAIPLSEDKLKRTEEYYSDVFTIG